MSEDGELHETAVETATPEASPADEIAHCQLCKSAVARRTTHRVNGQIACEVCVARIRDELAAQEPTAASVAAGVVGGLVGAFAGAAVWAAIAIATDLEVGYIAVLVGFLTGMGVKLAAGKRRGRPMQYLAAVLSIVGMLAAKYMLFAWAVVKVGSEQDVELGYLDARIWEHFPEALGEMLGAFDVIFVALAVAAAYRVPRADAVSIERD